MVEVLQGVRLVGRPAYVEQVRGWVSRLADGRGYAALVEGEPGIGKSALLRLAAREAAAAGCQVYWGSCDELSEAFPLVPLLDGLAVPEASDSLVRGRARIAELLRAEPVTGNRVDPVASAAEHLLALIDELCAAAPVLLVVDDLQWADAPTVLTLRRLTRSVTQLPLLVLCATRPAPRRDDLAALRRSVAPDALLRLPSLADTEVAEFVERAVGGPPGPRLLALAAGATGNPLYLTELTDALLRGGALAAADGLVEAVGGRVPESLPAAIADRLEFISPPVRRVLQAAALLGVEFSVSELAAVSGRRVNDLLPVLDEAIAVGVLRDDGPELAFRHPLIRAALYEEMPAAIRAAWHRDAARALAADGAPVEAVARQLLPALGALEGAGAVDDWIVSWLDEAAQRLIGQAPHVAVPLLRWAVTGMKVGAPSHDPLVCRLADALIRTGDAAEATKVATGALTHVTRPELLVDLHWTLTQCRSMDGRSEESLATLDDALHSPHLKPEHRARLLVLTARTHRSLGQVKAAGELADKALEVATAAGDRWATGWALGTLTLVHGMRGEESRALPLFDRALAVAEGDPALADLRLVLQINQANVLGDLDRYDAAIGAAEQARQSADDAGNVIRLAQAQSVLGELFFDVGRWDDALAEIDESSGVVREPYVECYDRGVAAAIRLHRGDAAASHDLEEAQEYSARIGHRVIGPLALARSLDREQADEPAQALDVLMAGLSDTAEEMEQTTDLLADAVRLAVSTGDLPRAEAIAERAEQVASASAVPHRQAIAMHCRGLLDHDPVRLLRAADHYVVAGRPLPRAQALEAAGVAMADCGDAKGAREHFTGAFSVYSTLNAGWDLARIQATFRAYGIRRGPRAPHRRSQRGWASLTPTELKVAGLVAKGMSNPQIASHLFLSRRTVQTHVSHILSKLDLHSRTDIAREASRRDLADA